jgi:hypothetical protein
MQNNRLSKEEEAAYVDSFFLPGGILDDFDEQGKEDLTPDEQRFFVPPLPVSSNPWDTPSASTTATAAAIPSVVHVANNDTTLELDSGSQSKPPLRRPPGLLPEPEDLIPSLLTPLPPEIERKVDNGLLQGLGVSHDLPSMMSHSALETPATTAMSQHPSNISLGSSPLLAPDSPLPAPDSSLLARDFLQNDTDVRQEHAIHDLLSSSSVEAATKFPEGNTETIRLPAVVVKPTTTNRIDALHDLQVFGDDQVASLTGDELIYTGSPLHEPTSPMGPLYVPTPRKQTPPPLVPSEWDVNKIEKIDPEEDAKQQPLVVAPAVTYHPSDLQENATSDVFSSNGDQTRVKNAAYDSKSSSKDEFAVDNGSSVPKPWPDVVEEKALAADAERRGRTNVSKLDSQTSRGDASMSPSAKNEDKRSIPATKKSSSSSDQIETTRRSTATTSAPGKIPVSAPRVSLPILRFLEDALMATVSTTITLFKWLASVIHGLSDAYEILVLVFRQVFMTVGISGVAVAKLFFLVASGLRNVGKYGMAEARHKDGSATCYLTLYLTPRICSLLMVIVDLPQYTPHVLSHVLIFVLCRQPQPDVLTVLQADSKLRRYESSGINEKQASDICAVILRTIRILLPLHFVWDGFEQEIATFLRFGGPVRMLLAFLLALVRGRLILSPVAWVSWSAQVLATAYCPRGLILDGSLLMWGLASIHLVRSLDSENIMRLHDSKFLHDKKSS